MATPNGRIKIEIESTSGTYTDITKYIKTIDNYVVNYIVCDKCFSVYPNYKYFRKFFIYLFRKYHKCR